MPTNLRRKPGARTCCPSSARRHPRATKPFAPFFRALGDETRLEIVGLLAAQDGELCVCEIEKHFNLGQPTISHHLRVLRQAGIVSSERRGTWVYYSVAPAALETFRAFQILVGLAS